MASIEKKTSLSGPGLISGLNRKADYLVGTVKLHGLSQITDYLVGTGLISGINLKKDYPGSAYSNEWCQSKYGLSCWYWPSPGLNQKAQ